MTAFAGGGPKQMQMQQMGQGGMAPSPGFMNRLRQTSRAPQMEGVGGDEYVALSNATQPKFSLFGGLGKMFGKQQNPYERYKGMTGQDYQPGAINQQPPTQAEGQPPMQFPQLEAPQGYDGSQDRIMGSMPQGPPMMNGGNAWGRPMPQMGPMMQPMGGGYEAPQNPYGRMKSAMMQGKQQMQNRPMPQMQGGPFNRRPMPQQPQPPQGPGQAMRRPMGNKMGGIGPSMM